MNDLGKIIKLRRVAAGLTLKELAAKSDVSSSYLGRVERGERFPSATVLRKIAQPLGFGEAEVLALAGFMSPQSETESEAQLVRLDPYVAGVLSQEPVEVQRTVVAILSILKSLAKGSNCNIDFAEYVHRKYPELDEDIITRVKDMLDHPEGSSGLSPT
ncbi:unnamed protein product [marine sediment metagenome]|uniref:HTH cro/C1-type domain-containing protein n=1 Tax=marine sediment metagenome TaxID=412755 RepID=X1U3N2_9ZZZZ